MKKIIAMIAVLALALSAAGCSKKNNDTTADTSQQAQTDVSDNYSEKVDMEKVDGEEAVSETDKDVYSGTLGDYEVSIGDVKVIEYDGDSVAVVSIEYKNKSNEDTAFTAALVAAAYQNDTEIPEATVVGVEGIEALAMVERVAPGDKITLQKTYKLRDSSPMIVEIREFGDADGDAVEKVFTF